MTCQKWRLLPASWKMQINSNRQFREFADWRWRIGPSGPRKGPAAGAQRRFEQWLLKRLVFFLLFAPILLWLVVLIVLPHIGLFIASVSERVGPREYGTGLYNYAAFFKEPLY